MITRVTEPRQVANTSGLYRNRRSSSSNTGPSGSLKERTSSALLLSEFRNCQRSDASSRHSMSTRARRMRKMSTCASAIDRAKASRFGGAVGELFDIASTSADNPDPRAQEPQAVTAGGAPAAPWHHAQVPLCVP
jgi:hypothetical protein